MKEQPELSPEFQEQRISWLRLQHRQPLSERFQEVLDEDGPALLNKLRAAYQKGASRDPEAFQKWARMILRACSQIPSGRRAAYVKKCASEMLPRLEPDLTGEAVEREEVATSLLDLLALISEKAGVSRDNAWQHVMKLSSVYQDRWPGDPERSWQNVERIMRNAAKMKYPLRYIDRVAQNERRVNKRRRKSVGGK